jgi:hypothetical protein
MQIEPGRNDVDQDQQGNGGLGRGVHAGIEIREVKAQQMLGNGRPHQLAAHQHAQNDGGDGQPLDPAIGLDQLGGRQQLGQDAVLGRRIGGRAQPDDGIGDQG